MHCCCTKSGDILQVALELLLISSMWLNVCTGKWPTTTWPHKLTILWNSTLYWHCTTFYHTLRSKNVWSRIWIIVHLRFFGTLRCTDIAPRSTIHNEAKKYMKSNWDKAHSLPAKILPYLFQLIYLWILQVSTIWNQLSSRVYVMVLLLYGNIFGGNEWVLVKPLLISIVFSRLSTIQKLYNEKLIMKSKNYQVTMTAYSWRLWTLCESWVRQFFPSPRF